jgi:hypothetical protein
MTELVVDWCSYEAAKYAVMHWHYSGTIPANKSNRLGVWEDDEYIGAVIFGLGASPSLGKPYGLGIFEVCELTRVAMKEHDSPVTQIVAQAIRKLKQKNPDLRLIVSFADPFHDHHGGIYQAGNWIYAGKTDSSVVYKLPTGELADPRRFNGHGHNTPKQIPAGTRKVRTPGKHRYLYPLDRAMRRQIEPLAQPYPKH